MGPVHRWMSEILGGAPCAGNGSGRKSAFMEPSHGDLEPRGEKGGGGRGDKGKGEGTQIVLRWARQACACVVRLSLSSVRTPLPSLETLRACLSDHAFFNNIQP